MDEDAVFRALADPSRRALLDALRAGPATTGSLAAAFPTTRFAVMKHLEVLVAAGLVNVERRSRERWNHLDPVPLRTTLQRWQNPHGDALAHTAMALQRAAENRPREIPMTTAPTRDLTATRVDVRTELSVAATPDAVWASLLAIGDWWPHPFRAGSTITLDARPGGTFTETWAGGGGAVYGVVRRIDPGHSLLMDAPMGAAGPVASTWSVELTAEGEGTRLTLAHKAFGDYADDAEDAYTNGWAAALSAWAGHATAA